MYGFGFKETLQGEVDLLVLSHEQSSNITIGNHDRQP